MEHNVLYNTHLEFFNKIIFWNNYLHISEQKHKNFEFLKKINPIWCENQSWVFVRWINELFGVFNESLEAVRQWVDETMNK